MDMNRWNGIGRLTRDPEIRVVNGDIKVANFTIACDKRSKNANGEKEANFINIVAWRKTAELVEKYCRKGMQVAIDGEIDMRKYQASDGSNRTSFEIIASNVQFLSKGKGGGQSKQAQTQDAPPDDYESEPDLPF